MSLDEKIVILDYANEHPKMGCQKITEYFSVRKTTASNILKDGKNLRKNFKFFKGNYKKRRNGKYHVINEILYNWYAKCTSASIYPDGSLLQEEAMKIKRRLEKEEFSGFKASNGWLDSWKQTYRVREKKLCGEANEVSTTAIQAWIELLPELCQDSEQQKKLNLDELGLFFKTLPEKGLAEKTKKSKGGKKSKQPMTVMFIVASDSSFVFEPTVIWRSKLPRCFKSLKDASRPISVHYFSNKKVWMNSDIMESILQRLDRRMNQEKGKVILFWDNVTCRPETAQAGLKNIKLVFLPKNVTSRLPPLDAGVIRNFKHKYRKLLVRYVVSQIDEGKTVSQIIEEAHLLKAITWLQTAWESVVPETIKHCFKKYDFDVGNT